MPLVEPVLLVKLFKQAFCMIGLQCLNKGVKLLTLSPKVEISQLFTYKLFLEEIN